MGKKALFVVLVLSLFAGMTHAALITGVERLNPDGNSGDTPVEIAADLQNGSLTFVDRTHEYEELPAGLLGADYIKVANDEMGNGHGLCRYRPQRRHRRRRRRRH